MAMVDGSMLSHNRRKRGSARAGNNRMSGDRETRAGGRGGRDRSGSSASSSPRSVDSLNKQMPPWTVRFPTPYTQAHQRLEAPSSGRRVPGLKEAQLAHQGT